MKTKSYKIEIGYFYSMKVTFNFLYLKIKKQEFNPAFFMIHARVPSIFEFGSLNLSIFTWPSFLSTMSDVVRTPFTFIIVLPISKIGSIASIGLVKSKYCPKPTADKLIDALVVAVPGTPAIPTELIVITRSEVIRKLMFIGVPVIFDTIIISIPGNIPAHPFIPVVAPKLATNVEVEGFTPIESKVSRVTGIHPRLDLDVNASINTENAFLI